MANCQDSSHWDSRFMAMADFVASWSKDPRKQVGAVIVSPDCRHMSLGYNGLPAGFEESLGEHIMDRDTKNRYTLHAEQNAISNAAQDVRGWTLYVTAPPCLSCALAINRAGITRIVTPGLDEASTWYDEQKEAEGFLAAMGIKQCRI